MNAEPTAPRTVAPASRRGAQFPRGLIFLASLWLIGSWTLSLGLRTPLQPTTETYEPALRTLLVCLMIGIVIAWPLLRMSLGPARAPVGQPLLDALCLLLLAQIVLWTTRGVTAWSVERVLAVDQTLILWTLLTAALLAAALLIDTAIVRTLTMLACLGIALLAPIAALTGLGGLGDGVLPALPWLSPLTAIGRLADRSTPLDADVWQGIGVLASLTAAAWIALIGGMMLKRARAAGACDHAPRRG